MKFCLEWVKKNPYTAGALGLVAVFLFLMLIFALLGSNRGFARPGKYPVRITQGMSTWDISTMLNKKGLVRNPSAFRVVARMKGMADKLQAGLYLVEGGLNNVAIMEVLCSGKVQMESITVPEGYTVKEVAALIEAKGLGSAKKFKELAKEYAPYEYMKTRQTATVYKAEGFLFPAKYDFPASFAEQDILALMVRTFHQEMEKAGVLAEVKKRDLHLRNVINLAAMVEKEAVFKDEQSLIAGVFQKRLDIDMPIQSDTTIQYILGEQHEIITWKDTEIQHPFNTYQNYGLPPGPIASPGLSAIKAALNPKQTDYLYFVAEKDGHHRFSTNYADHLQAIRDIENGN